MILIRPGDLVVSGINAAKGAIAVYDESAANPIAATIHYGAYTPKRHLVEPRFLWWMLRSRFFRELLLEHVPGGIKTELKPKRLLPIPIPLPSPMEQRRILEKIETLVGYIREATIRRQASSQEAHALWQSVLRSVTRSVEVSGTLADILSGRPRNGWSARCENADDGIPVLSLSAVTGYQYRKGEFKRTSSFASGDGHFWLKPGDVLITRSNTPELVGHSAIYDGSPSPCIYPDLMMRLIFKDSEVNRRFVWYWLQSPSARNFIAENATGTSPTMKKISQGTVMAIPYPSSLGSDEQQRIVEYLDNMHEHTASLGLLQMETLSKINALLPSVLDKMLRGEM
jgi:type I restriction enzyme, S subunit